MNIQTIQLVLLASPLNLKMEIKIKKQILG